MYLFDSYISPVLNYACELWCNLNETAYIESVHMKFLKYIWGIKASTYTHGVLGELGRFPIIVTQYANLLKN